MNRERTDQPGVWVRLLSVAVKLLLAWLFALALSRPVMTLNSLPDPVISQALAMAGLMILLAVMTWTRIQFYFLLPAGLLTALMLWLTRESWYDPQEAARSLSDIQEWLTWAFDRLTGQASGGDEIRLALLICLLIAAAAYLLLARFSKPWLAALAWAVVFFLARDLARPVLTFWSFLALLVIFTALARKQKRIYRYLRLGRQSAQIRLMLQSVPLAALILAGAVFLSTLIPVSSMHSRTFEGMVDDLASMVTGVRWAETELPRFSLHQAGFYPLTDRLGGPVFLSDTPVLSVSGTDEAFLLRGSVSQIYDGQNWIQDPDRSFYRYDSPLWQQEQTDIYDLQRPDLFEADIEPSQFNRTMTIQWTPVGLPTRTIFTPGKPLGIRTTSNVPFQIYFRPSGQLFSKYWIEPGQMIEMTARLLRTERQDFGSMISKIQSQLDEKALVIPAGVANRYLQLPDRDEYRAGGYLDTLVNDLTGDLSSDYEKVLYLRSFLMSWNTYNLIVAVPPPREDFVTWFLLTREGYCVYFATAMTMLSRLAGIPARYVEGYYAPAATAGMRGQARILTGQQAHAWTEVYLAGVGWITVDATPGAADTQPEPQPTPSSAVTPGANGTPTPVPTPEPTRDPLAPTPGGPTAVPTEKPDGPVKPIDWPSPAWLLFLLLVPLFWTAAASVRLAASHKPGHVQMRYQHPRQQILFYWREIKRLLSDLKVRRRPSAAPGQAMIDQLYTGGWLTGRARQVRDAANGLNKALYSRQLPEAHEIAQLAAVYDALETALKQSRGLFLWLPVRLFHFARPGFWQLKNTDQAGQPRDDG